MPGALTPYVAVGKKMVAALAVVLSRGAKTTVGRRLSIAAVTGAGPSPGMVAA